MRNQLIALTGIFLLSGSAFGSGVGTAGIANQSTLQSGAVFNVSSGTVAGQLSVGATFYNGAVVSPLYAMENFGDIRSMQTTDNNPRGILSAQINNSQASGHFGGMKARGTPAAPTAILPGDYVVDLAPYPYDGANYQLFGLAAFQVDPSSTVSLGRVPLNFVIGTSTGTGDGLLRMTVKWNGVVLVNTVNELGGTFNVEALANTNAVHLHNSDAVFSTLYVANDAANSVAIASAGNLSFATVGAGVVGQTNSTAPSSTLVGYQTSCTNSANFPTTDQYGDVCSIAITAGTWDFKTMLNFTGATITGVYFVGGIGTVTGNNGTGIAQGSTGAYGGFVSGRNETVTVPSYRVSVSGATTIYFKVLGSYSAGTPAYAGTMWATRVY